MTVEEWLGIPMNPEEQSDDDKMRLNIWNRKYRYKDETFDESLERISGGNNDVKKLIIEHKWLPGGRILANRGVPQTEAKTSYSNCYVIPLKGDTIEDIWDAGKEMARTYSYGGGVGIDISNLAPRGARIRNAAKTTTGAVSFMDLYSLTTSLIGQNNRRGALMISLDCHHPDLEEFIDVKSNLDKVTSANISVRVTDDFMNAVINDKPFELSFTREATGETITKTINAREVFRKLAYNNWDMGEPGILFWDSIKNYNLVGNNPNFEFAGVNPCDLLCRA